MLEGVVSMFAEADWETQELRNNLKRIGKIFLLEDMSIAPP